MNFVIGGEKMKKIEEKEFDQMLINNVLELKELCLSNVVIKDKIIEMLSIKDCEWINVQFFDCIVKVIKIENSRFKKCHFVNLNMSKENPQFYISESDFMECFVKNFHMNFSQKKSKVEEMKFICTEMEEIEIVADVDIYNSTFENCEINSIEFCGTEVGSCHFKDIKGGDCKFQAKFINNKVGKIDLWDIEVEVNDFEV